MKAISPSRLAMEAVNVAPIGTMIATDNVGACAMCGAQIEAGDRYSPFEMGKTFLDRPSLADPFSSIACGHCMAVRDNAEFMQKYSKSVVTKDGFFKIAGNDDQASFFLNPPPPPFLAFVSDAKQQHLIWRTPVSYSREVFHFRFGNRVLLIRHRVVLRVLASMKHLQALLDAYNGKKKATKSLLTGFDREMKSTRHGTVSPVLSRLATDKPELAAEVGAHLAIIRSASPGEYFAAGRIFLSNLVDILPEDAPALTQTLGKE